MSSGTFFIKRAKERGSTMLISMWALFLLSAVVFAWVKLIDARIENAFDANQALDARALAHTGVTVALHPQVTRSTPILSDTTGYERAYHATIIGEGSKLNISYLISGEDPIRLGILKGYLELRGLDLRQRERFVDCLLDWVGPPGTRHLNGAQEDATYKPSNKPLTSLEEIPLIKGSEPLVAYEGWRDDLTLLSNGPIDLECAPAEFIALIPGIGQLRAEQFVRLRQGGDQVDGTEDDHQFNSVSEALGAIGLSEEQQGQISSLVSYRDQTVRIKSVGEAGNVRRQVQVIARKVTGQSPQILLWTEK